MCPRRAGAAEMLLAQAGWGEPWGWSSWEGGRGCPSCLFQTSQNKVAPAAVQRGYPRGGEGWWGFRRSELVPRHTLLQLCFPSRRIFVLGIGFFTLCFLMTSLGGQFSAKRLGDSPFTIRTEGKHGSVPILSLVLLDGPQTCGPTELTSARDAGRVVFGCLHSQAPY